MKTETSLAHEATNSNATERPVTGGTRTPHKTCQMQPQNILVPLDFSKLSLKSLQYAIPFAECFGARLTLLHVVQPPVYSPELPASYMCEPDDDGEVEKRLERIRDAEIPAGVDVAIEVRHDFVFEGIVAAARETNADLIITTTHGYTGLKHLLKGSDAEGIVRNAPCPVLVLHEVERDFATATESSGTSSPS